MSAGADSVTIILSGEPQGKARPRFVRGSGTGFAYTPAHTRKYESALRFAAQQAMGDRAPFDGPMSIDITAAFPIPVSWPKWRKASAAKGYEWATTKPDADNILKCLDAFNEIIFRDDKQIVRVMMEKVYSAHPGLTIIVQPLPVIARVAVAGRGAAAQDAPPFAGQA